MHGTRCPVRAGSRIHSTCWTHKHINAYKYERWENKFYTHIKLFLLKVLSLLWIQHIKWYLLLRSISVYRWMACQRARMKNQMENIRSNIQVVSTKKHCVRCALHKFCRVCLTLGVRFAQIPFTFLRIYLRLRRKVLPLLVFIELFCALFVHRFKRN